MTLQRRYWLVFVSFLIGTICTIFLIEKFSRSEAPLLNFTLITNQNNSLSYSEVSQRPTLMFFGFTGCDSICPVTLSNLSLALKQMGNQADNINIFFVSVDPHNDTPERLSNFLKNFSPDIVGLTGDEVTLKQLFNNFGIYTNKIGENFDHSGYLYGFKKQGAFDGHISGNANTSEISDYIQSLINQ